MNIPALISFTVALISCLIRAENKNLPDSTRLVYAVQMIPAAMFMIAIVFHG